MKILPVKVLDRLKAAVATARTSPTASQWAANNGARVINLSLGGSVPRHRARTRPSPTPAASGVVVVAAAGQQPRTARRCNPAGNNATSYPGASPGVIGSRRDRTRTSVERASRTSASYVDLVGTRRQHPLDLPAGARPEGPGGPDAVPAVHVHERDVDGDAARRRRRGARAREVAGVHPGPGGAPARGEREAHRRARAEQQLRLRPRRPGQGRRGTPSPAEPHSCAIASSTSSRDACHAGSNAAIDARRSPTRRGTARADPPAR